VFLTNQNSSVTIEAMTFERTEDLRRRAALHGVLADEARLQIVDTLLIGDASPSELATLTGLPSNLLAHHLGVLETHGLIKRSRSEGDRRRSYVRLIDDVLDELNFPVARSGDRILFVCTANSARSQLAAAMWRRASRLPAASAGTHPADRIDPRAIEAAARHRLPLPRVRPQHIDRVWHDGDLIVSVCDQAHEQLERDHHGQVQIHWSVPDPVRVDSDDAFEDAFVEIRNRVQRLATAIPVP
jgi:protein-tyrosine-phosphatase/DNA-binding HxlR family transcriptional regulator